MDCWSNGNTQGTENYCRGKKTNESEENQKRGFNFQQRYGFDANSWVWVIKFEPCEKTKK